VTWYADPSGANERCELRCAGFVVLAGNNSLRPGIAAVSARLAGGTLRVVEGCCPNLLAEAALYRYGDDPAEPHAEAPMDESNHALAALRYLISRLDAGKMARSHREAPRQVAKPVSAHCSGGPPMKRRLLLSCLLAAGMCLSLLLGPASARVPSRIPRPAPQKQTQHLQGSWLASRGDPKNVLYTLTFNGDTITAHHVKSGKVIGGGTYQLDTTNGTINVHGTSGRYTDKIYRGLVTVHGSTMHWTMGDAGQARPAKVGHDPGSGGYLVILQPKN
jgi:hypothetical protein